MDFFARQDRARAETRKLIGLFVLAVAAVVMTLTVVLTMVLFVGADQAGMSNTPEWLATRPQYPLAIAVVVLAIIFAGSGVKSMQLRGGGAVVARSMGGDLVEAGTRDPLKRRLLNVVEEMAIAAGVPVPAVYVLDGESGVNAFAAGHSPSDAVVAVSRGALERFDRDELQGVIGHEFSHILNGDMRLNMRLIGFVAGLFAIAHVGRVFSRGSSRSRKGNGLAIAGLAMLVLGLVGVFLGRLIQAAISRQREFLADASAVQFTRDPQGLRDALVKVGAGAGDSRLEIAETDEVAHMLFASGLDGMFATHPPLTERIRALDPSFQPEEFGRVAKSLPVLQAEARAHAVTETGLVAALAEGPGAVAAGPVAPRVGNPRPEHVADSARRLAALPDSLLAGNEDPAAATTTLWALLLADSEAARGKGRAVIAAAMGEAVAAAAELRHGEIAALAPELRLPILLRLLPVLGRIPETDRDRILATLDSVIRADDSISVYEFALARLARMHLREQREPAAPAGSATLLQLEVALQQVLSVLARAGHGREDTARDAYERGLTLTLPGRRLPFLASGEWAAPLDQALDLLDRLRPADKARLVNSLGMVATHDHRLEVAEAELLRAICGSLHCPLPPFLGETAVRA
jgi:Zn-dependent protease with chaperone function